MDTSDRLAAYLAGDLSPADAAAVEEDLARDAALREELASMQRADEALEALASPRPSDGFEDRLRRHLAPVLAERLGTGTGQQAAAPAGTFDELAERRAARGSRNRWLPAVAGVAAAVAAVAVLTNLDLGSQDAGEDVAADMDAADSDDGAAGDAPELFAEDADEAEMADDGAAPPAPDGPTVVVADRDLDDGDVQALLAAPELREVAIQGFRDQEAVLMADRWAVALGAEPATPAAEEDAAEPDVDDDAVAEEETLTGLDAAPLRSAGDRPLTADEQDLVARCLGYLTDDAPGSRIPAYVELGTYDGEPVVVFGFVSEDPDTDAYTRPEAWVVGQDDCVPRYWRQE